MCACMQVCWKRGGRLTRHADTEVAGRARRLPRRLALAQPALHAKDHGGPARDRVMLACWFFRGRFGHFSLPCT